MRTRLLLQVGVHYRMQPLTCVTLVATCALFMGTALSYIDALVPPAQVGVGYL